MALERRAMGGGWRWRGSLEHGGVVAALLAGLVCLWSAVAVLVALLAQPEPTMATLERHGVRGVPMVVVEGSVTVLDRLRARTTGATR
ncbi:hypothetical protein TBR22_A26910 [Luteitalea sp. TBR-22]|nr:hypothetical protein TBR22_A26910 [Luteitalea sp. TBR-22]